MANGTIKWVLAASGKGRKLPQRKLQMHVTYPCSKCKLSIRGTGRGLGYLRGTA